MSSVQTLWGLWGLHRSAVTQWTAPSLLWMNEASFCFFYPICSCTPQWSASLRKLLSKSCFHSAWNFARLHSGWQEHFTLGQERRRKWVLNAEKKLFNCSVISFAFSLISIFVVVDEQPWFILDPVKVSESWTSACPGFHCSCEIS